MRTAPTPVAVLVCMVLAAPVFADDAEYARIREGMKKLAPLMGQWRAAVTFHDEDGITREEGTYEVSSVLDDTYLEIEVERHRPEHPSRRQRMLTFITFNPKSNEYETTDFYSRWATRVTETGLFDDAAREFRTKAFIPLEDGVNDEAVRAITTFKDPNRIVHRHYSRRSPKETCEHMDLEIVLTRAK
ncbi:MAG TPA: DUF1579 family protein [Thermoanaerobaculia bacterium]